MTITRFLREAAHRGTEAGFRRRLAAALIGMALVGMSAEGATWKHVGPYGGTVNALLVDPSRTSTLYAGTLTGGVFKSTDFGDTWVAAKTGLSDLRVTALVLDASRPSTILAGTRGGIFRSTNGGASWVTSSNGLSGLRVTALASDPGSPGAFYAGIDALGVFRTTDGGSRWSACAAWPAPPDLAGLVWSLAVAPSTPSTPSTVYAGSSGSIWTSTDGGASWAGVTIGDSWRTVTSLTVHPTPGTLFATGWYLGLLRSTDSGRTFVRLGSSPISSTQAFALNPRAPWILYLGSEPNLYRSTDEGVTWGAMYVGSVWSLALDPDTPSTLYAGLRESGVLRSMAWGAWSVVNVGLMNVSVPWVVADPGVPSSLYAVIETNRLVKSTDSGSTWGTVPAADRTIGAPAFLVLEPTTHTLYAVTGDKAWRTTNGGEDWERYAVSLEGRLAGWLVVDPSAPATVYGSAHPDLVLRSTDDGLTWAESATGLGTLGVGTLAIDTRTAGRLYAGGSFIAERGVARSTDSGGTWTLVNAGLEDLGVRSLLADRVAPTTVYAATTYAGQGAGVYRSTNGGDSWQAANRGLWERSVRVLVQHPGSPGTLYAGTENGVFRSLDSGSSWEAISAGLPFTVVSSIALDTNGPTTLYVATENGGLWSAREPAYRDGDLNEDDALDVRDVVILASELAGNVAAGAQPFTAPLESADLDRDGDVDVADLQLLVFWIVNADPLVRPKG